MFSTNLDKAVLHKHRMAKLSRIPTLDFDRNVTAVAMDDRFILIGQEDGHLSAVYHKNGIKVFSSKITEAEITAVCCEEQDEGSNQLFYAADSSNNIFIVNKKGNTISEEQLKSRKGKIHTLVNTGRFTIQVLSSLGTTTFTQGSHKLKKGKFSTKSANYSLDGDGTFNKEKGTGDYNVTQYDCRNATNTVATFRVKFGKKIKNYRQVLAYATFEESYVNLIEEGTAEKTLDIFCSNNRLVRRLEFTAPVMQVMSCRHHQGQAEEDMVYFLLWNGNVLKVGVDCFNEILIYRFFKASGSLLEDPEISDDELDLVTVVKGEEEDEEDNDDGEYKGFCVYSKKIVVFGYDGLHTVNLAPRRRSHRSIRVLKERVVAPIQERVVSPIFSWLQMAALGIRGGQSGPDKGRGIGGVDMK